MSVDEVIESLRIVSHFNPNMSSLYDRFVTQAPLMSDNIDIVNAAYSEGLLVYDCLVRVQVELANAIHDYTYNVTRPFDSTTSRNNIREQTCRDLFGLPASF